MENRYIQYEEWNPHLASRALVNHANDIIEEYQKDGYTLTLRQLYYQFVARALLPNTERSYKNLVTLMTKARKGGQVSWTAIHDANRNLVGYQFTEDSVDVVKDLQYQIMFDQWARQDTYIEVWVEKDALSNVIGRACRRHHIPYLACKGYLSTSEGWEAGQRFRAAKKRGKDCVMIHLGDHDPEGIDMTRDNNDRLHMFSHWENVKVRRIALNMDQVEEYDPPPNYAKVSSSRYSEYVRQYGVECWELDALEPQVIETLLDDVLSEYIDLDTWNSVHDQQDKERSILATLEDRWAEVVEFLKEEEDDYE